MLLREASQAFDEVLRIDATHKFMGQVANLDTTPTSLDVPLRLLLVDMNSTVAPRTVCTTAGGFRYLLGQYGDDHYGGVNKRAMLMIPVNTYEPWSRFGETTDPVSGLSKGAAEQSLGNIWVYARNPRFSEQTLRIPEAKYQLITGANLQERDRVGPFTVMNVETRFGVTFAEAK